MTCPRCGRYGPPDPETGYDGDDLCPACMVFDNMATYSEETDHAKLLEDCNYQLDQYGTVCRYDIRRLILAVQELQLRRIETVTARDLEIAEQRQAFEETVGIQRHDIERQAKTASLLATENEELREELALKDRKTDHYVKESFTTLAELERENVELRRFLGSIKEGRLGLEVFQQWKHELDELRAKLERAKTMMSR